jgi:hypothetical protein
LLATESGSRHRMEEVPDEAGLSPLRISGYQPRRTAGAGERTRVHNGRATVDLRQRGRLLCGGLGLCREGWGGR